MKELYLGKSRDLENEIDLYLKSLTKASLLYLEGSKEALSNEYKNAELRYREIAEIEKDADNHLKNIHYKLIAYNIAPDSRADIFELLGELDDIANYSKKILFHVIVEKPSIPECLREDFNDLTQASSDSIDILIQGVRVFFEDINILEGYLENVYFYEKKADKIEEKLKINTFQSDEIKDLSERIQMRHFIEEMALLSDLAEEIAKNLIIYKIKRTI